jgi:hypothetical protein
MTQTSRNPVAIPMARFGLTDCFAKTFCSWQIATSFPTAKKAAPNKRTSKRKPAAKRAAKKAKR